MRVYLVMNNQVIDIEYDLKRADKQAEALSKSFGEFIVVATPRKMRFCYDNGRKVEMSGKLSRDTAEAIRRLNR